MQKIFVFGSNLAGRHGMGSAYAARKQYGAVYGIGVGRTGSAYAIPTKDRKLNSLPLKEIALYVEDFLRYARQHSDYEFNIVAIGCGLAGYAPQEIAPMFKNAPLNCNLPKEFKDLL